MKPRTAVTMAAGAVAVAASVYFPGLTRAAGAQTNREGTWIERTPWGDPDRQGEWTSEGEYGVPLERPAPFGTAVPDR